MHMTGLGEIEDEVRVRLWVLLGRDPWALPGQLLLSLSCCLVPWVAPVPGPAVDLTPPAAGPDQNLAAEQGMKPNPGRPQPGCCGGHPDPILGPAQALRVVAAGSWGSSAHRALPGCSLSPGLWAPGSPGSPRPGCHPAWLSGEQPGSDSWVSCPALFLAGPRLMKQ